MVVQEWYRECEAVGYIVSMVRKQVFAKNLPESRQAYRKKLA